MTTGQIGILGSGDVGRALSRGFGRHDWNVKLGTRRPDQLREWVHETDGTASVGTFTEAATYSDTAILAVMGSAVERVLDLAGPESFEGTLLIDTTNPLDFSVENPPGLLYGGTESLGERIQEMLPNTSVVKCFNTVSNIQMVDPEFEEGTPPMMICGNDRDAKHQTESILQELGWPGALDVGTIGSARYLEALVPLWVRVGTEMDTWMHAFKPVT